jgi:oligopeptide/dipeptide ABC transporter ATP-binding protein
MGAVADFATLRRDRQAVSEPLLDVRDVRAAIGDRVEIGPVALQVGGGESVGIVGESGSGKTLFCRTVAGLIGYVGGRVTAGAVSFDGKELTREGTWPRQVRQRGIGFVPQASQSGLNPVRRVRTHFDDTLREMGVGTKAARKAAALELLARVRLPDPARVYDAYRHQLSGGMQQRVMIALALATEPKLLIADEPTTALDATVQAEILDLIDDLRREAGMALVVVSHDLNVIGRLCQRTAVMYAGRLAEVGRTRTLLDAPRHPYTQGLIKSDPLSVSWGTPLMAIPGQPTSPQEWSGARCNFAPRCPFADARCTSEGPRLEPVDADQSVACLKWRAIAGGAA